MDYLQAISEHLEKALDVAQEARAEGKTIPMIAIADDGDRHSFLLAGKKRDVVDAFLDVISSNGEEGTVLKDIVMAVAAVVSIHEMLPNDSADDKDDR